ncbi:unnamed protein product [Kuraishia capsulata CBS 1993]|uniref:beta-glucosidase n=1 Tax=Kuraishia capsulata CBS 1993 TaxID=1382522 RepID=W6MVU6_9ASCO|nr:uncharacterized protein KUCA_T00002522001 [Kuraishia capsulata CBS 1993]CDK26550.1 unnamed protein product [Kuraishia capsulata CBS 1993]
MPSFIGIPSFCLQDGPLGVRFTDFVTDFPSGLAAGSTFSRGLMYLRGKAIALEHKRKGVNVVLGPVVGPIGLKAAGGRNWEGFGADPYLQGVGGSLTVQGIQDQGLVATVKHLIGNEQEIFRQVGEWEDTEWGGCLKESISSNIGDRAMHEVYLWPFADCVHAGVGSVMCSYNRVNNTYACENSALLNKLLKSELGFQGWVMSDWGAQHTGVYSCLAGLDMSMPGEIINDWCSGKTYWGPLLTRAVYNQTVSQERLSDMATRILASFFMVGGGKLPCEDSEPNFSSWTYHTYSQQYIYQHYGPIIQVNWHIDARTSFTEQTALKVAKESIVLLRNTDSHLPINYEDGVRRILIAGIASGPDPNGFNCKDQRCVNGAMTSGWGSGSVNNPYVITPYEAVAQRARKQKMVVDFSSESYDLREVQNQADYADVAIVFVTAVSGEGFIEVDENYGDRKNVSLWHNADELINKIADRCRRTIVVINSVGPVDIDEWINHDNVVGVLWAAPLGQFVGEALASIIFGEENPSGRLPFTIAKKTDHYVPILTDPGEDGEPQDTFDHDIYLDYKFFDKHNINPYFEFGFGLSYSSFKLGDLEVSEVKCPSEYLPRPAPYLEPVKMCGDDICDPVDALFPYESFNAVPGFIYPYLFDQDIYSSDSFEYPKNYIPDQPSEPPIAGGGLGGNPALWETLYKVTAEVYNKGDLSGSFVAQLYIEFPCTAVASPSKQLRGFEKIFLESGASGTVCFEILHRDLSYWDTHSQEWVIQEGTYKIYVGSSSRKLDLVGEIDIQTEEDKG